MSANSHTVALTLSAKFGINTILTGRMAWTCSPKYNSGVACYSICPGNNAQVSELCRVGSIDSPENDCYLVPIRNMERDWPKGLEKNRTVH